MIKSKKEQELELEVKRLKKENETLKKTVMIQSKQLKIQNELLEDLQKENKTQYYKNKYELALQDKQIMKKQYEKQLQEKGDYISKLKGQIQKNSSNSSKPSSTDGFKKVIHNCRENTGKRQGGQEGHKYHSANLVEKPDKIVKLPKPRKCTCGGKIEYNKEKIKRQLIELITKYEATEYQGNIGRCKKCGRIHYPNFPVGINNKVQYGNSVKGLSLILSEYGNVPVDKIKEIIGILTNTEGPCSGSIMNWKKNSYEKMKPIREDIKEEMLKEPIINNDETPYNLNGKKKYAIGAFTEKLSVIECNGGREKEAFEKMNIYPRYAGTIMGDHYAVNESFQGEKAYCNAHTIRTAKGVLDVRKDSKAKEYIENIYKIKKEVEKSPQNKLSKRRYKEVEKEYTKVLEKWKEDFNKFMKGKKTEYYDDERKLINLLLEHVEGHLLFAKKDYVMFTNNPAENGLRPVKSKMKVIGGFRNQIYSDGYSCALSIIQTAQKQRLNPCEVLGKIISGQRKIFDFQHV